MIIKSVKKLGYSLIEAVIAVTVLSIILVTGISVIVTATQTEATNKNYLIANMLAQEGIEAVKNIYYSNILRFGSENANSCAFVHLTLDSPVDEIDTCGSKFIWAGSYILKRDTDSGYLKWLLGSEAEDDDYTGAVMANTEDDTLNPIYRLYLQNNISGIPTYTHESIGTEPRNTIEKYILIVKPIQQSHKLLLALDGYVMAAKLEF